MHTDSSVKLSVLAALALLLIASLVSPAQAVQSLDTIQLDNGILLRDWINLPAVQSVQPPLETGERAAMYIKRYGAYRELLDIVMKATRSKPFNERSITAENSAQKLAELDTARKKLGEWPQLIISHAKAASLNGKPDAALADLKSWLKVAPVDEKRRKEIVALVVESETDGSAVTRYFGAGVAVDGGPGIGEINERPLPTEVAGMQKLIEQTLNCTGRPRSAIDAEIVTEGKHSSDSSPFYSRLVYKYYGRGLWSSEYLKDKNPNQKNEIISVSTPISSVYSNHLVRHVGGPDKGSTERSKVTLNELSCSAPFFPLKVGKEIEVKQVYTFEMDYPGGRLPSIRNVMEDNRKTRVIQVYTVNEALKKFPNLRITGTDTENWLVYELSSNYESKYRSFSDTANRHLYKPSSNPQFISLFIEGPNLSVSLSYSSFLQPGWTATVRELPQEN